MYISQHIFGAVIKIQDCLLEFEYYFQIISKSISPKFVPETTKPTFYKRYL